MDDIPPLDEFSRLYPLPYRLATLIILGIALWGFNLSVLKRKYDIDLPTLVDYPGIDHHAIFHFATALSGITTASILTFWFLTYGGDARRVLACEWLPNLTLLLVLAIAFLIPSRLLHPRGFWPSTGRSRFLFTLRRISTGRLGEEGHGMFGDVLLADALTSYARPLSDLYTVFAWMVTGSSTLGHVEYKSVVIVPVCMAIPYLIRLRQCAENKQLYNALKYATAVVAIALSTFMQVESTIISKEKRAFLWAAAALINAAYSWWWDVTKDWDLTLMTSQPAGDHPYGLRHTLHFAPWHYYAMIALDFLLRWAWAIKLSPHLDVYTHIPAGVSFLESLEVFRRFLWVYFRAETEWVRKRDRGELTEVELRGLA